ncbi:voltage-gated potassium channel [Athelia psychrophila]|uniref:Voltage-gated potassium channel n=1 Tax=Athelia psychrophila TaxID=1759441 RepID=A0A166G4Y5_9AGAM|nr:voltage-gated potassium channel [Fibularhizoctonia sp. CBS 109695]
MAAIKGFLLYITATSTHLFHNHDPEKGPPTEFTREDTFDMQVDNDPAQNDNDNDDEEVVDTGGRIFRRFDTGGTGFTSFSSNSRDSKLKIWLRKVSYFIFPPKEDVSSFVPNYRTGPIFSGIIIPFSILLEVPGLTDHWYVRTEENKTVEYRPNPLILDVGLSVSLACALIANVCLVMRFMEHRIKTMTISCVIALTIHDIINITAVATFGVVHRFDDGFTYGQPFWMTVCATIASTITNITLVRDLYITPDFNRSGSGLTRRQRSLVIIIIILFTYLCLGALANALMQKLSFIDGLYFSLVSIETIGFGDIVPKTTATRMFSLVYAVFGIMNLGVAIGMCRETILEALEVGYRKRVNVVRERRKEARKQRRVESRWRRAVEWRLQQANMPMWIHDGSRGPMHVAGGGRGAPRRRAPADGPGFVEVLAEWTGLKKSTGISHSRIMHGPPGMRLNLEALTHSQLEASALEAGVPLETLIPEGFLAADQHLPRVVDGTGSWAQHPLAQHIESAFRPTEARTPTHGRIGAISLILTRFAFAATHNHTPAPAPDEAGRGHVPFTHHDTIFAGDTIEPSANAFAVGQQYITRNRATSLDVGYDPVTVASIEKKAFYAKLTVAWTLFIVFWTIGSAIFSATEKWSYGTSMYFCFVAFSTIGYGDYSPQTPAGRSIFVVWAILGVGALTILISVVQEAYDSKYKRALHIGAFDKAVKRYRVKMQTNRNTRGVKASDADVARARINSDAGITLPESSKGLSDLQCDSPSKPVQEMLEAFPFQILQQARSFNQVVRAYAADDDDGSDASQEVIEGLKRLLDEITRSVGIGRVSNAEIMQETDARHTLFRLSIEKALLKMIDAAEDAVQAIQARDAALHAPHQDIRPNCTSEEGQSQPKNDAYGLHTSQSTRSVAVKSEPRAIDRAWDMT